MKISIMRSAISPFLRVCAGAGTRTRTRSAALPRRALSFSILRQPNPLSLSSFGSEPLTHTGSPPNAFAEKRDSLFVSLFHLYPRPLREREFQRIAVLAHHSSLITLLDGRCSLHGHHSLHPCRSRITVSTLGKTPNDHA